MTRLFTGFELNYEALWDGVPFDFDLRDIIVSLSRIPRYLGHTGRAISVLEHCNLVSSLCIELAVEAGVGIILPGRAGLLHDAAEAIVGDLPAGLRAFMRGHGEGIIDRLEDQILEHVFAQYGVPRTREIEDICYTADMRARAIEISMLTTWPAPDVGAASVTATIAPEQPTEVEVRRSWLARAVALSMITPQRAMELLV